MGQIPERKAHFYFAVGRTIYEDDVIEDVGVTGVGWWVLLQAVACDHDGLFEERIAKRRLASYGDVSGAIRHLYKVGLLEPIHDQEGWWAIVGWHKYQSVKPKSGAERQREWRDRQRNGP